jgi:flagellar basal body rod protein FlgG
MRFARVNTMDKYERVPAKKLQPSANSQKRQKKGGDNMWGERTRVENQARALYVQGKSKMLQGFTEQSNNKRRF